MELEDPLLSTLLEESQLFYQLASASQRIERQDPMESCCELIEAVPLQEEVDARYDLKREPVSVRNFLADQRIAELKGCLGEISICGTKTGTDHE